MSTTSAIPTKEMRVPITGLMPSAQAMSTMRMLARKRMVPTVRPVARDRPVNMASGGATPKPPSIIMPRPTPTSSTPTSRAAQARLLRRGVVGIDAVGITSEA